MSDSGNGDQRDWRPRPDPTILTTEALMREVGALKELLEQRIDAVEAEATAEVAALAEQLRMLANERADRLDERIAALSLRLDREAEAQAKMTEERAAHNAERIQVLRGEMLTAITAQRDQVAAAFAASEKAITVSQDTYKEWRVSQNEWRGAMSDRDRTLPTRETVEAQFRSLDSRMDSVYREMTEKAGTMYGNLADKIQAVSTRVDKNEASISGAAAAAMAGHQGTEAKANVVQATAANRQVLVAAFAAAIALIVAVAAVIALVIHG